MYGSLEGLPPNPPCKGFSRSLLNSLSKKPRIVRQNHEPANDKVQIRTNPKAQSSPEAIHSMTFGPKAWAMLCSITSVSGLATKGPS